MEKTPKYKEHGTRDPRDTQVDDEAVQAVRAEKGKQERPRSD